MVPKHSLPLQNSAATIVARGALAAVRIGFLLWVARQSDPELFGRVALCFSIVEVLRVMVDFGTENLFLRNLAREDSKVEQATLLARFATFRLSAVSAGLVAYALAVIAILPAPLTSLDVMVGLLLVTSSVTAYALTYYQSKLAMSSAAWIVVWVALFYVFVLVVLRPAQMETQLGILVSLEATTAIALLTSVVRRVALTWKRIVRFATFVDVRNTAVQSLPLGLVALLVAAYTRLDVLVIGPIAGAVALGLYSYAYRVSEPFRFIGAAADSTIYSYLSARLGRPGQPVQLPRMFGFVALYSIVLAVGAATLGYLLTLVGYEHYRAALPTVAVLSVSLFVRCINGFLVALLYACAEYGAVLKIALCNTVLMGVIIYPAVSWFGILGAAFSLLVVEVLNFVLQSRLVPAAIRQHAHAV